MPRSRGIPASATFLVRRSATVLSLGFVLLCAQSAEAQNGLTFFKNYFVTGDYIVAGVGLKGTGINGVATGNITIPAGTVPAGAEPVAAFLYWLTVTSSSNLNAGLTGAKFKGNDISGIAKILNPQGTSPCWSEGGGTGGGGSRKAIMQRADVLRFFEVDTNGNVIVNGTHEVKLADSGSGGNQVPFTEGASLLVVYRKYADPLRAIVIYDGGFIMDQGSDSVSQTMKGFYQASSQNPTAKASIIIGEGQQNFSEQVLFNSNLVATNPFVSSLGASWDNPTFDVSSWLPGNAASAIMTIDHDAFTPYDCLSGGAFILSTTVQDTDNDGLLDKWEESAVAAGDYPTGQPQLPDLAAMGAHKLHKDLFIEIGYMFAVSGTTYGTGSGQVLDGSGHHHLPSKAVVDRTGDAFKTAPVTNPDGFSGIDVHFDVGNNYAGDPYVIPFKHGDGTTPCSTTLDDTACLSRGGEAILETACVQTGTQTCAFPDYPGTVGWKVGFQYWKDAPVGPTGAQLDSATEDSCRAEGSTCRRRFDRNRKDIFHYGLHAHALGVRVAELPCLDPNGNPADFNNQGTCPPNTPNPNYLVPRSISGMGDFPGGDYLETFGLWGNKLTPPQFNASEFVQASTLVHELGHNFWLTHSGDLFVLPDPFESNCNPNYLSVMSYLFQIDGVRDANGVSQVDLSRLLVPDIPGDLQGSLNENSLPAGLGTMPYRTSWFAPRAGVDQSLGTTAAKRHCDGSPLSTEEEADRLAGGGMVRVDGAGLITPPSASGVPIDWNGDLNVNNDVGISQDVTFDGHIHDGSDSALLLRGSQDWSFVQNAGLLQLGSRRNAGGYSLDGKDFGGKDFGGKDFGGKDFGGKDFGGKDFGGKDFGGDQDFETATATGHPPTALKAERVVSGKTVVVKLTWNAPHVQGVNGLDSYQVYRVDGPSLTQDAFAKRTLVGTVRPIGNNPPATTFTDSKITTGKTYTYFVIAAYVDGSLSHKSNLATLLVTK